MQILQLVSRSIMTLLPRCGILCGLVWGQVDDKRAGALEEKANLQTGHFQLSSQTLDVWPIEKYDQRQKVESSVQRDRAAGKERQISQVRPVTWEVYVPEHYTGEKEFGVFVYISPASNGRPVQQYLKVVDEHDLIWIGANNSGNDVELRRRCWLALEAVARAKRQFKVDVNRVYVGGFSGGGRVSSIVSVTMPDYFAGGFFMCGCNFYRSINLGGNTYKRGFCPKLPKDVIMLARENRYVFCTGSEDGNNKDTRRVYRSYQRAKFKNILLQNIPDLGHTLPPSKDFEEGIKFLDGPFAFEGE